MNDHELDALRRMASSAAARNLREHGTPYDPRTVAAWELEDRIARGEPIGPEVTVAYSPLPVAVQLVDELVPEAPRYECALQIEHYANAGVPLHPRRLASRVMEVRVRDLVIWRAAVCRDCGLADFVVVERAVLRQLGRIAKRERH